MSTFRCYAFIVYISLIFGNAFSDTQNLLWTADTEYITNINQSNGTENSSISSDNYITALAVNNSDDTIWAYSDVGLTAYELNGQEKFINYISQSSAEGNAVEWIDEDISIGFLGARDTKAYLQVNYNDNTIWVAVGNTLSHFENNQLLNEIHVADNIQSIALDIEKSRIWVATKKTLIAYDDSLSIIQEITLGRWDRIQEIHYNSSSDVIWVAVGRSLRSYNSSGILLFEKKLSAKIQQITSGGNGIWGIVGKDLYRWTVRDENIIEVVHQPKFISFMDGVLIDIVDDSQNKFIWILNSKILRQVFTDGSVSNSWNITEENGFRKFLAIAIDSNLLDMNFTYPLSNSTISVKRPQLILNYKGNKTIDYTSFLLSINDQSASVSCSEKNSEIICTLSNDLAIGLNDIQLSVKDSEQNEIVAYIQLTVIEEIPPVITVESPKDKSLTNKKSLFIVGSINVDAELKINQTITILDSNFRFNHLISLQEGNNPIQIIADYANKQDEKILNIILDSIAPLPVNTDLISSLQKFTGKVTISGQANAVEGNLTVKFERNIETIEVISASNGQFSVDISAKVGDILNIIVIDKAGNYSSSVAYTIEIDTSNLPPDPSDVAPEIEDSSSTTIGQATKFLYQGNNPIQTGVIDNTIEAHRAAVIKGRTKNRQNKALSGVKVSILNHPEYGQTLSRTDGEFDIAVNGGRYIIKYEKNGYLSVQRNILVPWQDYSHVDDVVLILYDSNVTTINFSANNVAQRPSFIVNNTVNDKDGDRKSSLFFPQGVTLENKKKSIKSINTASIRATEYTVGETGLQAMPGTLPPSSGYTYAVELSVDQSESVQFSQPIYNYVDNFMNFPVGTHVPVGYYDHEKGAWIPSKDGLVISIHSISNGKANIQIDGSGGPADNIQLSELDFTDSELEFLAQEYATNNSLWRVPITHFSSYDYNWPYGLPNDATPPNQPPPSGDDSDDSEKCDKCNGSLIEAQNQVMLESLSITGSQYSLHYRSDRVLGRKSKYRLKIPLTGDTYPVSLKRIDLEIMVAGQIIKKSFDTIQKNQVYVFVWDGKDSYGRLLQGQQKITTRVGYVYDPIIYMSSQSFYNSFATISPNNVIADKGREEYTIWQEWDGLIGLWRAREIGLGSWTLNVNHNYDPIGKVLHMGNGAWKKTDKVQAIVNTDAGGGNVIGIGDGLKANKAELNSPADLSFDSVGNYYIVDKSHHRIRKVDVNGVITTVAGNGGIGFSGDGNLAINAELNFPSSIVTGNNKDFYIADTNNNRIRHVNSSGIISTIAGNGISGFSGDDGLATNAQLSFPDVIAITEDGTLLIADKVRIRQISRGGLIHTIAGGGNSTLKPGEKISATEMLTYDIGGIAIAQDGVIYWSESQRSTVFKLSTDGLVSIYAGNGTRGDSGDGELAINAKLDIPGGLAISNDGVLYISDYFSHRIRKVLSNGIIDTLIGQGENGGFSGDNGFSRAAKLQSPRNIAIAPGGSLFIADGGNNRIRKVSSILPSFNNAALNIPSADGSELYQFDTNGLHLSTINTYTNGLIYQFSYQDGRISSVTDAYGNKTQFTRDNSGKLKSIITPWGVTTDVLIDNKGYLEEIYYSDNVNINQKTKIKMVYDNGLLIEFHDKKQYKDIYRYDDWGLLEYDRDPVGGSWSLSRKEFDNGFDVEMSRLTKKHLFKTEVNDDGRILTHSFPNGTQEKREYYLSGKNVVTKTNGIRTEIQKDADPRFNILAAIDKATNIKTPNGIEYNSAIDRVVTLTNDNDPLTLIALIDKTTINGNEFTKHYDAATKNFTNTTPEGRITINKVNEQFELIQETIADVYPVNYSYDSKGLLKTISQGELLEARKYQYDYNSDGYLKSVINPLDQVINYEYYPSGLLWKKILPGNKEIIFNYDNNNNITSIIPVGKPAHEFEYTKVDLKENYIPPNVAGVSNGNTTYQYNKDKQIELVIRPDGKKIDNQYNADGQLREVISLNYAIDYQYFSDTKELEKISIGNNALTYKKDGSLITQVKWSGEIAGTVDRVLNNYFNTKELIVNGVSTQYLYDNDGLLTGSGQLEMLRNLDNGFASETEIRKITTFEQYDNFAEQILFSAQYDGTKVYEYEVIKRDKLGRIKTAVEAIVGTVITFEYDYDDLGRLEFVHRDDLLISTYQYDDNGNRVKHIGTSTSIGQYDDQDRLISYAQNTYTYTNNGELLTKTNGSQVMSYEYDVFGNLIAVDLPDGKRIEYIIDGKGRRIGKKNNATIVQGFLYSGLLNPVAELDGNGNVQSIFVYGDRSNVPSYMLKNGNTYRIIADHLGSPKIIINVDTGDISQQLDYDEFGNVILDTNPSFQPFGYAGGLYDRDTGLTRFGARDYDPEIGRWTSKDPVRFAGDGPNLYGYVLNDPVNFFDRNGLLRIYESDAWGISGINHVYIWSPSLNDGIGTSQNSSGGTRTGPGWGDKGAGNWVNVPLPDGMTEKEALDNLKSFPGWNNSGIYIPFVNDCHSQLEGAFKHAGIPYTGTPNGRFDPPSDRGSWDDEEND